MNRLEKPSTTSKLRHLTRYFNKDLRDSSLEIWKRFSTERAIKKSYSATVGQSLPTKQKPGYTQQKGNYPLPFYNVERALAKVPL